MMFSNMASGICKLQQLPTQIPSKLKEHILYLRPHNINPQGLRTQMELTLLSRVTYGSLSNGWAINLGTRGIGYGC